MPNYKEEKNCVSTPFKSLTSYRSQASIKIKRKKPWDLEYRHLVFVLTWQWNCLTLTGYLSLTTNSLYPAVFLHSQSLYLYLDQSVYYLASNGLIIISKHACGNSEIALWSCRESVICDGVKIRASTVNCLNCLTAAGPSNTNVNAIP